MLVNFASTSNGLKYTEYCQKKKVCVIVLTYTQELGVRGCRETRGNRKRRELAHALQMS